MADPTTTDKTLAADWLPNLFADPASRHGLEKLDQLVGRSLIHEHDLADLKEMVAGLIARPPVPIGPQAVTGTIVPLYTRPDDKSWTQLLAAKAKHKRVPIVAVINGPSSGPGPAVIPAYVPGVARLVAGGVLVIGYVFTDYGNRPAADVRADIDRWRAFYPGMGGVFFDEMSSKPGLEDYYRQLSVYAKAKGLAFTVANPGADTAESFIGTVDTMLIYESKGVSTEERLSGWHAKYPAANFGVIPYGIVTLDAAYVKAARAHVGWIYMTNDTLPNPWDTLPGYFEGLLAALE